MSRQALTGTNLTHAKQHNLQIVHETIRLYGPISRAEVARKTRLTAQTVSNLVRQLIDEHLVLEVDRQSGGRGAPSIRLEVNPSAAFAVGLDFDVDHLTAVLVNLSGEVQQRIHRDLSEPTPDEAVDLLTETVGDLIQQHGLRPTHVWGVGVGVPGPMVPSQTQSDTYVVSPWALSGWHDVPLAERLHERLALPVFIENNATAAAVGEHWYGEGRHVSTFFYVYLGSGLGGGLVVQGHPFEGYTGNVGEVGYLPPCSPTGDGGAQHLGELFNLRQLYARMQAAGETADAPGDLVALLEAERPAFMEWLDEASEQMAFVLLAVEYLLDPGAIFIGGRWPNALLKALLDRASVRLSDQRIAGKRSVPDLRLAMAGTDAAALGVATLPLYSTFAPRSPITLKRADSGEAMANRPL
jgi:predicted NBD/HSP70 family sugar kinase